VVFVNENLIPLDQRTKEEQREIQKKGGQASVAARRKKRDIKKALQALLDENFTEFDGKELNGVDMLATTLFNIARDEKHKQCIQAQRLIYELTGMDKSVDDKKRIKQALKMQEKEIELIQKRIDNADW
jgi:hypothetical protein